MIGSPPVCLLHLCSILIKGASVLMSGERGLQVSVSVNVQSSCLICVDS